MKNNEWIGHKIARDTHSSTTYFDKENSMLKPCPFCGGEAEIINVGRCIGEYYDHISIQCKNGCVIQCESKQTEEEAPKHGTEGRNNGRFGYTA